MSATFMRCGHSANAVSGGEPVCAICFGSTPDAAVIDAAPDLTGRMARCSYDNGGGEHRPGRAGMGWRAQPQPVESSTSLPFFAYRPDEAEDRYYCGCWGWD